MRKKSVPILICTIAICLGAFLLTNVPLDGLKDEVPKPVALAHHKFRGDALSTLTHSSLAQTYREPPITQDEAKAVELELLKKGFAKLRYSSGVLYSKNVGGIMPVRAFVRISSDGIATCTALRSKWFWQM